jgi:hypothetical protein
LPAWVRGVAGPLLRGFLRLWRASRPLALGALAAALLLLYVAYPRLQSVLVQISSLEQRNLVSGRLGPGSLTAGNLLPAPGTQEPKFRAQLQASASSKSGASRASAGAGSREEQCRSLLEVLYQRPFPRLRPAFLTHPASGRPLELDMYNKELKLAVEHDGLQHRAFVPWMHKTEDVFRAQQQRDRFKDSRCVSEGVDLIRVPDTAPDPRAHLLGELRRLGRIS